MGPAVYHHLSLQCPMFKSGLVHVNLWQSDTGTSFYPSTSASPIGIVPPMLHIHLHIQVNVQNLPLSMDWTWWLVAVLLLSISSKAGLASVSWCRAVALTIPSPGATPTRFWARCPLWPFTPCPIDLNRNTGQTVFLNTDTFFTNRY